jgi:hypothetical protein
MAVNPDFRDLLKKFNEHRVEYLVIGAYALMYYTVPRYTKDIDVWVNPTRDNARRVRQALKEFGAPLKDVSERDFTDKELVYQIGIEPNRIDIMMGIGKMRFSTAWKKRRKSTYGDVRINILGKSDLIRSKMIAGRPRDLLDASELKKLP